MKATAPVTASPTAVAQELRQMTVEAGGLKVGLEKAEADLARLTNRLKSLTTLVGKQAEHLGNLKGSKGPPVVSLPAYSEMRLKLGRSRTAIGDCHSLIATTTKGIAAAKTRLKFLEEKLKTSQAILDSYGKLLPFKRKP